MTDAPRCCPRTATPIGAGSCQAAPACRADASALMPRDGVERAVMLALRFIAAAADTGDAACWDAAFDRAEAEFGPRDGALLVARAAALLRAQRREEVGIRFLPPPCRWLSPGEADLLGALRMRLAGQWSPAADLSGALRAALADLVAPILPKRIATAAPKRSASALWSVDRPAV